jgi:hypothetical protein
MAQLEFAPKCRVANLHLAGKKLDVSKISTISTGRGHNLGCIPPVKIAYLYSVWRAIV